jgi:cytochrome bd ubiquinol oxidase subunit I
VDTLLAARLQMAVSLGFHILFAVAGMAMPLLMVIADWRHLRNAEPEYRLLAESWAKGTAILFAVGAVSGTVLSFELGLLWPGFMRHAGPLIGMPFSLEGFAFFLEAIALGIYLYGRKRVSARAHLASGAIVAVSGVASGVFVVAVNAWMNTPRGFRLGENGEFRELDLWAAAFTPAFPTQAAHMVLAAYSSVAFAVLGIHAFRLLREPASKFHQAALRVALPLAIVTAPLQALTGDAAGKQIAKYQPAKLAAAEALFETSRPAPLLIGGLPDVEARTVRFGIHVPHGLSMLAHGDANAEVQGLDAFPREDWPNVRIVHFAFQVMVGCGTAMLGLAAWGAYLLFRKRRLAEQKRFLVASALAGPLGLVAVEAGWVVTEVGRQPWIIQGVMRTRDAVTPMPNVVVSLVVTCAVYAFLGVIVLVLLARYVMPSVEPPGTEPTP